MSEVLLGRQLLSHVIYFVGVGFMADKCSCVELILKHSLDACVFPKVAVGNLGFVVAKLFAKCLFLIVALGFYSLGVENVGNGFETVSVKVEREYSAYYGGLFLDYDYLTRVFVFEVAHRRDDNDTRLLFLLVSRANLFGDVAAVHIVKDSLESDDKLIVLVACVDVLGDR